MYYRKPSNNFVDGLREDYPSLVIEARGMNQLYTQILNIQRINIAAVCHTVAPDAGRKESVSPE